MKRLISFVLCALMVFGNVAFAVPMAPVATESAQEVSKNQIQEQEAVLTADPVATMKPGLNVYTGQVGIWDFQNANNSQLSQVFATRNTSLVESVEVMPGPFDADNKAMGITTKALAEATSAEKYPTVEVTVPKPYIEYDRPVYVTYKVYRSVPGVLGTDFKSHGAFWMMKNTVSASNIAVNGSANPNAGSWSVVGKQMMFNTDEAPVNNIKFEYNINASDKSKTTVYIDDLAVVPGYAVIYNDSAAVYAKDYVKVTDANGTPEVTSVTVRADGPATGGKFVGWSTKKNGTVADIVTSVAIGGNEDVNLYPVYEYNSKFPTVFYDFETGKQGWTNWGVWSVKEGAGTISVERTDSSSSGGAFVTPSSFSAEASKAKYLYMRVKTSELSAFKVYFSRTGEGNDEARTFSIPIDTSISGYQEVYYPITHELWTGTVIALQINSSSVGIATIDEIGFYEELPYTRYDWNDGTTQGWTCGAQITAEATGTALKVTRTATGGSGEFSKVVNFKAGEIPYLKLTYNNTSSSDSIKVYWRKLSQDSYSEDLTFNIPLKTKTDGYVTDVIDFSTIEKAASAMSSDIYSFMMAIYSTDGSLFLDEMEFTTKKPQVEIDPLIAEYTFDSEGDLEGWKGGSAVTVEWENKGLKLTRGAGTSGALYTPSNWAFNTKYAKKLVITLKNTSAKDGLTIYYTNDTFQSYNEGATYAVKMPTNMTKYENFVVDLSNLNRWDGKKWMIAVWPTDAPLYIDRIAIYSEYVEEEIPPVYDITLNATATEITTDGGTVTVTPNVVTDINGAKTTVSYKTDNSNVAVKKNTDGSVTLTGKMNGETILTAVSDYDPKYNESITIKVSGQTPKTAFYDINVFMLGNSILAHGYHEQWPQGPQPGETAFGMAATKPENDYVHRFNQVYMAQKYGATQFDLSNFAAFEREIAAEDNKDYTDGPGYIAVMNKLRSIKNVPELITIQMGENVSVSGLTAKQYENAVTQLIDGLREIAPDAEIVVCTPFWGGKAKIDGMKQVAEKLGLRLVHMDTLNIVENMAYDTAPGVCQSHPGDLGMDRMAQLLYDQVNITLTENMEAQYVSIPTALDIVADKYEIDTVNGTLQLGVDVTPVDAADAVKWSVDNANIASVDEFGLLTAVNNGTVTVKAVSRLDETVTTTKQFTISGQTPCYTLTYDAGTNETVTNLPENFIYAKDNFALNMTAPEREYYIFNGWALEKDSTNVVESINVTEDTTVYASWRKAETWMFDINNYFEGITTKNGFNVKVQDGEFQALATDTDVAGGKVLNIVSPKLNIDASTVSMFTINVQNTAKKDDTKFALTIHTTNGDVPFSKDVTTTAPTNYNFELTGVTGTITGFTIIPTNTDCAIVIDQMGFVGANAKIITYNTNTTDTVNGMPANAIALSDKYSVSSAEPTRAGYTFIGWATQADSILPVKNLNLADGTTLYAIWDINAHWDFSLESEFNYIYGHNNDTLVDMADGKLHFNGPTINDPQIGIRDNYISFAAAKYSNVEMRFKYVLASGVSNTASTFFWLTNNDGEWDESKAKYVYYTGTASNGYEVHSTDLSTKSDYWKDKIVDFRIDPISGKGEYWVDYVRFTDADDETVFVIKEGMTEKASEIPYKNVLVDGGTLVADGNCTLTNLAIASGNVDLTGGTIKIAGKLEIGADMPYVNAGLRKLSGIDFVYFTGENSIHRNIEAGSYLVKLDGGSVYFTDNAGYSASALYKIDAAGNWTSVKSASNNQLVGAKNTAQIRSTGNAGMRFLANVAHSVKELDGTTGFGTIEEYGFVVGRTDAYTNGAIPTVKDVESGKAVKGIAYNGTVNKAFEVNTDYDVISCVLYNVPMEKTALMTSLTVVPYVTINTEAGLRTVYGQYKSSSIYDVALGIYTEGGTAYTNNKEYIDNIFDVCQRQVIISDFDLVKDEDDYYRHSYNVVNPYTATKITDVYGTFAQTSISGNFSDYALPIGAVAVLDDDGNVIDNNRDGVDMLANGDGIAEEKFSWLRSYNGGVVEAVPISDSIKSIADIESAAAVNYTVTANTRVVKLSYSAPDVFRWGSVLQVTVEELANSDRSNKCYNDKVDNGTGVYKTSYAKYQKAYISANSENQISYVVLIVQGNEALEMLV